MISKENSIKYKTIKAPLFLLFLMITLNCQKISGQVQNNDVMFIGDDSSVFLSADISSFTFGAGSSTTTTRTNTTYGKLVFAAGVVANGASNSANLNGYGSTRSTSSFTMPIGNSGVYAPIVVVPSSVSGVDAAYFHSDPNLISSTMNSGVAAISTTEYWDIKGANSQITLSWRSSSDATTITNADLANLIIVGFNGVEWIEIPSTVDTTSFLGGASSLTAGSISSNINVNLSLYNGFTIGRKMGFTCAPVVASSGNTKTWNGTSWSPSAPTIADPVIINGAYSGTLECNSLVLNANITLNDGQYVDVVFGVTGSGKIIMSSEASVVQRDNSGQGPTINLTKRTRSLRRNDYTYFGTPISGNFFSQLSNAQASTGSLTGALDGFYKYNSGPIVGSSVWEPLTSISTGSGYIARVKNQAPFFNNYTTNDVINVPLNGVANNGDISVAIKIDPSSLDGEGSHNLLANPYPCAISGDKFITDNTNIDGVIYIWQAQTLPLTATEYYSQSDYITYTKAGITYPVPSGISNVFNGKIASGQGFVVLGLVNNSNVTFTNCMRLKGDNTNFNRSSQPVQADHVYNRFKLNMTSNDNVFSQILIGYYPEATTNYDRTFDARKNSASSAQLFSIMESDGTQLAINARPDFDVSDVVPLGVSKENSEAQEFTIAVDEKEGIFNQDDVTIYLHDKLLGVIHNIEDSNYSFSTDSTSMLNRFEIIYQNTLGTPEFNQNNDVVASIKDNRFQVQSLKEMESVDLYDIVGRKIASYDIEGLKMLQKPFFHPDGIYIMKVHFSDQTLGTQKLINRN